MTRILFIIGCIFSQQIYQRKILANLQFLKMKTQISTISQTIKNTGKQIVKNLSPSFKYSKSPPMTQRESYKLGSSIKERKQKYQKGLIQSKLSESKNTIKTDRQESDINSTSQCSSKNIYKPRFESTRVANNKKSFLSSNKSNIPRSPTSRQIQNLHMKRKTQCQQSSSNIFQAKAIEDTIAIQSTKAIQSIEAVQNSNKQQQLQLRIQHFLVEIEAYKQKNERYEKQNQKLKKRFQKMQNVSEQNRKLLKQKIQNFNREGQITQKAKLDVQLLEQKIKVLEEKIIQLQSSKQIKQKQEQKAMQQHSISQIFNKNQNQNDKQERFYSIDPVNIIDADQTLLINQQSFIKGMSEDNLNHVNLDDNSVIDSLDFLTCKENQTKNQNQVFNHRNNDCDASNISSYGSLPIYTVAKAQYVSNDYFKNQPCAQSNNNNPEEALTNSGQKLLMLKNYQTISELQELIRTLYQTIYQLQVRLQQSQAFIKDCKCTKKKLDIYKIDDLNTAKKTTNLGEARRKFSEEGHKDLKSTKTQSGNSFSGEDEQQSIQSFISCK